MINLRKTCQNNPLIGINSLREKIVSLREVSSKASFDILCVDETKNEKNFETENPEAICLELVIAKKKWCILFAYRPPDTNKTMFFNEIYITLNKILGKYDNILLAGDLNIDELKTGSDSSNHLSDAKDVFNLTNLVQKPLLVLNRKMELLLT